MEANTPASHTIRITATDDGSPSKSSSATFSLTVSEVNDAPSTPSLTDQDALVSRPFSYTFAYVTDPEGSDVTYSASLGASGELPSWLSFDADGLTLSGTPGEIDAPAELVIRITAIDDADPPLASSAEFTLTVSEQNGAPQAVDDTATVAEGHALTIPSSDLLANDSDPDGQTLVITGVGNAVYGTVTLSADGASVTYRHSGSESASGSFTYTVSDGAATDTATVTLTVTPVNDPPAAPYLVGQTAVEDEQFSYWFVAVADPESDGVAYTSALAGGGALPSWLSFNATTRAFGGTPREADTPATLTIVVTATDDGETGGVGGVHIHAHRQCGQRPAGRAECCRPDGFRRCRVLLCSAGGLRLRQLAAGVHRRSGTGLESTAQVAAIRYRDQNVQWYAASGRRGRA